MKTTADRFDEAYDEGLFGWFLSTEQRRSERSRNLALLLLVEIETGSDLDPSDAATLFAVLRRCLRKTDIVGWYRQELVVGALLAGSRSGPSTSAVHSISQRVTDALGSGLPPYIARGLRVSIRQHLELQRPSVATIRHPERV